MRQTPTRSILHARIWKKPGKAAASGGGAIELVVGEKGDGSAPAAAFEDGVGDDSFG